MYHECSGEVLILMARMDFKNIFYNQRHNRNTLISGLDSVLETELAQVTTIPYACENNEIDCFKSYVGSRTFEVIYSNDDVTLFKLIFYPTRSDSDSTPIEGDFFVCRHPSLINISLIFTLEPTDFLRRALFPFIEQHKSRFYLTFLRHEYLHQLLRDFQNKRNFTNLTVVRASHVNRFEAGRRETMIPTVSWPPGLSLESAFSYAQEQNAWFRSLSVEAYRNNQLVVELTVHRNGVIKTNHNFHGIYDSLVLPICNLIDENIKLFTKRARRENPQLEVRPLAIQFGSDQFKDIEENTRFISAIRKLDNASISVIHGNPYISMSVVDYSDGSTFDLWVLNSNELVIIPQLKSSIQAMKRLISCVFDNYAEGEIKDFHS